MDSVPFVWEMDSRWHANGMGLFRVTGKGEGEEEEKVEVGRCMQKCWDVLKSNGAAFVVDEGDVDGLVAILSLLVVLKKKRQRQGEE